MSVTDANVLEAAQRFFVALQEREEAMINMLRDLVNRDTPSGRKDLLDASMAVVEALLKGRDAQVERVAQDEAGDHLVARWAGIREHNAHILILTHLDTVWPAGEATRRPFSLSDGRMRGPGVFDMKSGLVQAIFAIDVFRSDPETMGCDITLAVTSDEENGSITSRPLIERLAREADVVFVAEPAAGTMLKTARKGVGMYTVRVDGVASHAGLEPEKGRSAILELAHQIVRLHGLSGNRIGSTVNVGIIEGGSARNVVPATATATVDLRVVTAADAVSLDEHIRSLQPLSEGTRVTIDGGINRPPMERTSDTGALYARAEAIAAALGDELGETAVGGGSDANFTAALGVPTLDGLGSVGGGAHALDEHALVTKMPLRAALLAGLLHDVAERGTRIS